MSSTEQADDSGGVPEREEIDDRYKWNLADLYADDEQWEAAYEEAEALIEELAAMEGTVGDGPAALLSVMEQHERTMRTVSNVASYARMRSHEDTRDQEYQALSSRASSLASKAQSAGSFLEPELQALGREAVEEYMETEPTLREYDHYFDDVLRMQPHTRSAEVEELLADLGEVTGGTGEVYSMLTNADMTFPSVEGPDGDDREVTLSNFTTLLKEPDRAFRQRVHDGFYGEWETVRNAVGTAYAKSVKADVKLARARNYDTAREAALDGPNVPVEVYDNLVETVRDRLGALHRHAGLKREALGVDELRPWDFYAPMVDEEAPEVPYEQAKEWVTEAVAPLGEDYRDHLAEGLESRWVDVYENRGKQSGAYSGGTYDSQPFILMNYQDDVASMFTLAHELGHSMHSELASDHQPYVYSGYEIFVAEVASTVNETLLTHYLLNEADTDERLRRHVLDEYLERVRSTLFRQTMFAEFEHRTHEMVEADQPLTPDRLDELYADLKADYYEPAELDDGIAREWMRIPHFYRAFYVYQYATGISAAVALVERMLEDPTASEDYLEFLRSGSREYPLELLGIAGVDMSSPAPVEAAIDQYDDYLDEFAALE
jgi:oligoendopeptidase F